VAPHVLEFEKRLTAMDKIPLSPEWHRALELLTNQGERGGITENVMFAHGFTAEMVASLALSGLATRNAETIRAGGGKIEVTRVRITDAGRYMVSSGDRMAVVQQRSDQVDDKR
jgi:hypothetical protein